MIRAPNLALRMAVVLIGVLALVAVFAPALAPYDPDLQPDIVALKRLPPSLAFPFGTDPLSRDVLSRVIHGSRVSLAVASASVALMLLVGTVYGAVAASAGHAVDTVMMRTLDVALSIPRLLVLVTIVWLWTPTLTALILVIGLTGWYEIARLVRNEMQSLLTRDFVVAARAGGVGHARIVARHLLPHLLPVLAVSATLGVAQTIALETGLSYLGFGVQAPTASWGSILHDGSGAIGTMWWLTLFPGIAIVTAVLACNALGDALRDRFATEQVHA